MKILVDTNRYTDFANGSEEAMTVFGDADEIAVPFVVVAEIRAGFHYGNRVETNEELFSKFLRNSFVRVLYPDEATTRFYADIYARLRRQGTPVPTNDLWIAALALQHSLPLYTRDKHFDSIPQLGRIQ